MVTDFPILAAPRLVSCSGVFMGAVDKGNPSFLGSGAIGGVGTALGVNSASLRLLFHISHGPYLVYKGYREMANGEFRGFGGACGFLPNCLPSYHGPCLHPGIADWLDCIRRPQ